jgi:hypothetical protein
VTIAQLKKVFCESLDDYADDQETPNTVWAFAKVNLYLRMASGEHSASVNVVNTYKKPNLIEISANWLPTETDIKEAQQYVDEKNLTHEFASLDDLYINFQPIQWEID